MGEMRTDRGEKASSFAKASAVAFQAMADETADKEV
jgi:hypothetical protein